MSLDEQKQKEGKEQSSRRRILMSISLVAVGIALVNVDIKPAGIVFIAVGGLLFLVGMRDRGV